jgi:hypothetical protein
MNSSHIHTDTRAEPTRGVRPRQIAWILLVIAGTLGVASSLHLAGTVHGTSPFDAEHAGIAEAIIGTVLLVGAIAMLRRPRLARTVGLAATGFATIGFLVGLSFTTRGGRAPDIAYHLVILPVLVVCFVSLARDASHGALRPARTSTDRARTERSSNVASHL